MKTKIETAWTTRCAAFGGPVATHKIQIDGADVLVYDSVAGHYTRCHGLSDRTVRRIVRRVAAARAR